MKFILVAALMALAPSAHADQVLVLSGGGSPFGNHYSQYLQTKTMTDHVRAMVPGTEVSVLFGGGNATGATPALADVHRVIHEGDLSRTVMEFGYIDGNQAATRANVDAYFASNKVSSMRKDETFFLLVSDHGFAQQGKGYDDNCIDLWTFTFDVAKGSFNSGEMADHCYSKSHLKKQLTQKVAAGRTVFAMSQCYSGGFHQMSVDSSSGYPKADAKICGFTAITEDTTASGCTPDVDGPGYQGYERYFTEQLTGVDVASGARLRNARKSLAAAHRAATVQDLTKDIPLATSDYFLWKWALAIEKDSFVPRTSNATADQAREALNAVAFGSRSVVDRDYVSKETFFARMQQELLKLYPELRAELTGPVSGLQALRARLQQEFKQVETSAGQVNVLYSGNKDELIQQWSAFVESGKSTLAPDELKAEKEIFTFYDKMYEVGAGASIAIGKMAIYKPSNPEWSNILSQYGARRETYAREWAQASGRAPLVKLVEDIKSQEAELNGLMAKYGTLEKQESHVRRLIVYRQVLGAWNALWRMGDDQALNELRDLIGCEATKLP